MLIPEHKIEEVLARVDLVELVGRHVELKKAGRTYKGCCPFHQEKTPSFNVNPEMKRYKCFGCQAGGDAISFVQRYLGKSFTDAVRDLAREVGVDLAGAEDPTARERAQLREATDAAQDFFRTNLWDEKEGALARKYLEERGVSTESAKKFGLGWAPASWDALAKRLLALGILDFGANAGLVAKRNSGDGYYDMFRGRLTVPIRSPEGRAIAFGGRLLIGEDGPKYLNSRESRLYNKSETLYGTDQARDSLRRAQSAILVEGYFDCIGLHQVGVTNSLALCSTALTPGHLTLLKRLEAKEVVLLLDGDSAGIKAVERLAGSLLASGTPTKVALLPLGDDPDVFARREGEVKTRELLANAKPLSEHLFTSVLPGGTTASFEEKLTALERLKPTLAALPVGLYRSAFLRALSQHSGLPAQELEVALRGKAAPPPTFQPVPKPGSFSPSSQPSGVPGSRPAPAPPPERPPDMLESAYVASILRSPGLLEQDVRRVGDELKHAGLRRIAGALGQGVSPEEAMEGAGELVRKQIAEVSRQLPEAGLLLDEGFGQLCRKLKLRRIDEQLSYLARVAGQISAASELTEETKKLQQERVELLALKRRVLEEASPASPAAAGNKSATSTGFKSRL